MKITLHVRDEAGWPILTVDPPSLESGDRVRVINYAQDRFREIAGLCAKQREMTKDAKAHGFVRHPSAFLDLWRGALTAKP